MQIVLDLDDAAAEQVCAAFGKVLGSVTPALGVSFDGGGSITVDVSAKPTPRSATPGEVKTWLIAQLSNVVAQVHEAGAAEAARAAARESAAALADNLNIT